MSGVARGAADDAPLAGLSVAVTSILPWRNSGGTGRRTVPSASASRIATIVLIGNILCGRRGPFQRVARPGGRRGADRADAGGERGVRGAEVGGFDGRDGRGGGGGGGGSDRGVAQAARGDRATRFTVYATFGTP